MRAQLEGGGAMKRQGRKMAVSDQHSVRGECAGEAPKRCSEW